MINVSSKKDIPYNMTTKIKRGPNAVFIHV